jgi:hypothetical protein
MTMREGMNGEIGSRDIEVSNPEVPAGIEPAVFAPDDRPVIALASPPPSRQRRPALVVAAVLLPIAAIVVGVAVFLGGGDDVVAKPAGPGPKAPAVPAVPFALSITVDAPATVVAGEDARFVVQYADGLGIFSGGSEDWGDVGASSTRRAVCGTPAAAATALDDSYVVQHAWDAAGTYPVIISVTTYTCQGGEAVEETATTTLQVTVG